MGRPRRPPGQRRAPPSARILAAALALGAPLDRPAARDLRAVGRDLFGGADEQEESGAPVEAGRKSNPDAPSRQTTRDGRGYGGDKGTIELQKARVAAGATGQAATDFPLDILHARGEIDVDQHREGMAFARSAWAVFGVPAAGCAALYQRMVGAEPGRTTDDAPDTWLRRQRLEHEVRVETLSAEDAELDAVRRAAQYLELSPRLARRLDKLKSGLRRLVATSERRADEVVRRMKDPPRRLRPR